MNNRMKRYFAYETRTVGGRVYVENKHCYLMMYVYFQK